MAARQPQYSPKLIADALGASESSVKRWCDQGSIPTIRTVGGHRRITLDGLRQFLEASGQELVDPSVLGLPRLQTNRQADIQGGNQPEQNGFRRALVEGNEEECRQILRQQLDAGWMRSEAAEFLITDAMHGIGNAWSCDELDAYQERRGCDISIRLINELRSQLPPQLPDAPIAIGGSPAGDSYQLPTALVELALREAGWNALSLGCNLPTDSFLQASHDYQPKMIWMSVSHVENESLFIMEHQRLATSLDENIAFLIGGRALTDSLRPRLQYTAFCDGLRQLTELANMIRLQ